MSDRRRELQDMLLAAAGDSDVLAKGRTYEHKALRDEIHISGPGSAILVTNDEIVWFGRRGDVRSLPFASISSYSEATQYHRYALVLDHTEVRFSESVPAHRILWVKWGEKREPRSRIRTCLAFSSRDADAATAIRVELDRRRISPGRRIELPEPSRAERTAESHAELHPRTK